MSNDLNVSPLPLWRQNLGYGSALVGLLGLVLGLLWLVQMFLTPGAPSTFDARTCLLMIVAGSVFLVFGIIIVWPKKMKRP